MNKIKKKKTILILSIVIFCLIIPAVVAASYFAGGKRYYLAGAVTAILSMIPFFVDFERSRGNARYLAVAAVMTALAVVSRAAFFWAPNFKPMAGVIIITASALGPRCGFMCGALSMLISNFIFGQGPWTPWQMLCYGLIGFTAGLLSGCGLISRAHNIISAICGFFIVFIFSTILLDTCSVLYFGADISIVTAAAIYLAGIPVNISNAAASAICIFLLIKPLSSTIARIKLKYDINTEAVNDS